jgi:hypothetical protein
MAKQTSGICMVKKSLHLTRLQQVPLVNRCQREGRRERHRASTPRSWISA